MKVACALVTIAVALGGCAASEPPRLANARPETAGKPVRAEIYLGVDCREPETIACDRVAMALHLTKPADQVTVTIADRRRLIEPMDFREEGATRRWQTRFGDVDLESSPFEIEVAGNGAWSGRPAVRIPVSLSVRYRDGSFAEQVREVRLSPVYCG